jgi:hypothetical protein
VKKTFLYIGLVLVILVVIMLGIRFLSGEDNWICKDGQWVKHGNPSEPMPTKSCEQKNTNANENKTVFEVKGTDRG